MKKFVDLSDEEIKQIVNDIFAPNSITHIKRYNKQDYVTCNIKTVSNNGKSDFEIESELYIGNPFELDVNAISVDFDEPDKDSDLIKLKQFCVAKGVLPEWAANNPYEPPKTNGKIIRAFHIS